MWLSVHLLALYAAAQFDNYFGKEDPGIEAGKRGPESGPRPSSVGKHPESDDTTGIPRDCGTPSEFRSRGNPQAKATCSDCAEKGSTGQSVWAKHWLRAHNVFRCMHGVPPVKWYPILECYMHNWLQTRIDSHSNAGNLPVKGAEILAKTSAPQADLPNAATTSLYYYEWLKTGQYDPTYPGSSGRGAAGHFAAIIWTDIAYIGCARGPLSRSGCIGHNPKDPDDRPNGERSKNVKHNYRPQVVKSYADCEKEVKGDGTGGSSDEPSPSSSPTSPSSPTFPTSPASPTFPTSPSSPAAPSSPDPTPSSTEGDPAQNGESDTSEDLFLPVWAIVLLGAVGCSVLLYIVTGASKKSRPKKTAALPPTVDQRSKSVMRPKREAKKEPQHPKMPKSERLLRSTSRGEKNVSPKVSGQKAKKAKKPQAFQ